MNNNNFYSIDKVNERIFAIKSINGEFVYLILGNKEAVLIDTCVGIGNLKELVESLTDLPIKVILTHGHIDHAMGAPEFETVYLNPLDIKIYKEQCLMSERINYLQSFLSEEQLAPFIDSLIPSVPDYKFVSLNDGDTFDLGDLTVEVYSFPGHTPGMMVVLISELRILILGDACNNSTFLFDENSSDVTTYLHCVERINTRLTNKFDSIYISHHEMTVSNDIMNNMIAVCHEILQNRADDIPFEFMGMNAYIAKKCDSHFHRLDGLDGNLIYSKNKLFPNYEVK